MWQDMHVFLGGVFLHKGETELGTLKKQPKIQLIQDVNIYVLTQL